MKTSMANLVTSLLAGLLAVSPFATAQTPAASTPDPLAQQTVHRRAVDAVIWGLPLVGEDAVKQAAFRDGKASYNDIVWWPKGGGWKNQSLDVDTSVRYLYIFCNTKSDGPIVLDVPPAVTGASFY